MLKRSTIEIIQLSYIRPIFDYGGIVWDEYNQADELSLERVQVHAALIFSGAMKNTAIAKLYEETGWETLSKRREHQKLFCMYKIVICMIEYPHGTSPNVNHL